MKFIHTADWHLGNSMHDIDRTEESEQFLGWLKNQIVDNGAEALVVSGDVFDVVNPSNIARSQYFRFLASLQQTCCKNIVIVAGNHDSGSMLDAPKELLEALNIHVVGNIGEISPEKLVFELRNSAGEVSAICAAVPFAREPELRRFVEESDASFSESAHKGLYSAVYAAADNLRAGRDIPVIATGHLYASKLEGRPDDDKGEGMREHGVRDIVGNLGTVPVTVFPEGFDYVALGHIHYTTMVAKNPKVRYSGSPFILGFDESKMKHCVLLVDSAKGAVPDVKKIETPEFYRFERVCGTAEEIRNQLMEIAANPGSLPVKVEVFYKYKPGIKIRDELGAALESDAFSVVNWRVDRSDCSDTLSAYDHSVDDVKELGDEEIFRLLVEKNSCDADEAKKNFEKFWPTFKQLMDEVEEENQVG